MTFKFIDYFTRIAESEDGHKKPRYPMLKIFTLIEWSLLKNWDFINLAMGCSISFTCLMNFYVLLPTYAENQGLNQREKADLLSVLATVDLFTRFVFASMGDWQFIRSKVQKPRKFIYAITVIGLGITMCLFVTFRSKTDLLICAGFYSFFAGGIPGCGPMVYLESFPHKKASAMGLASIIRSITSLGLGLTINLIKNYGNVDLAILANGFVSISWMCIWFLEDIVKKLCRTHKSIPTQEPGITSALVNIS